MMPEIFLERLANLNVWTRRGQRAPQKPLLLLLALARVRRRESRLQPYTEIEKKLTELLTRFGPSRQQHHPEYPFVRLVNDKLWETPGADQLPRNASGDIAPLALRSGNIKGGLPQDLYDALRNDDALLCRAAEFLLENEFPRSYHRELLEAVGFGDLGAPDPIIDVVHVPPQIPEFRRRVITAYEHRCAVCDYDIRIDDQLFGLEAAHIRWRSKGGPNAVPNGLALCTLHRNALDMGGISVDDDMTVLVSPNLHGRDAAQLWFLQFAGKPLRNPRNSGDRPDPEYLDWHRNEVFRK